MIGCIFFVAALLTTAQCKSLVADDKVRVQVYYESLCPDSIRFIVKQLFPTYYSLGEKYIDLELIPYGHASEEIVNGTKSFECQHGPQECVGNKFHACAINLASSVAVSTEFIFCSERSEAPSSNIVLKECADVVGISWTDLRECASGSEGDDLLSEFGKKTDAVKPNYVPYIVINGEYSDQNQEDAELAFKELICDLVGFPSQCKC